jgi:hypothetical protein
MKHVWGRRRVAYIGYWWGKPERKRPLGRPRHGWEDNTKIDLQVVGRGVWNVSSWLRLETGGGNLRMR